MLIDLARATLSMQSLPHHSKAPRIKREILQSALSAKVSGEIFLDQGAIFRRNLGSKANHPANDILPLAIVITFAHHELGLVAPVANGQETISPHSGRKFRMQRRRTADDGTVSYRDARQRDLF